MENGTVTIQVDPVVAQILHTLEERAKAQGLTLNSLLSLLVPRSGIETAQELALAADSATPEPRPFYETATPAELAAEIEKWMDSHDPTIPALPLEAVSRESIYEGR